MRHFSCESILALLQTAMVKPTLNQGGRDD
jgi:hypothetical protein